MKITFTAFFIFLSIYANSQINSFKGALLDTVENKNLSNAVISLLIPGDSILYTFTRADSKGNFIIKNIFHGKYILMITHPYYADYVDNIDINNEQTLKNIYLIPKSKLLQAVIIKTGSPIKIKGDTTEYTADSFKVKANANVEDLLRKMPGIQVDKNGEIKAMGEKVTKVLVDGEEFFGDDPGVATKNLRADAVDKVQVFDKKSDQATFTGIDDGKKDKTINLKLKDSKKNGFFGKASIAGGLPDYYSGSVMVNAFKGKRKIAAYGMMSNTGQTQLSWKDNTNYGGNDMVQTEFDDATGSVSMYWSNGGDDNYSDGRNGIPVSKNVGIHYNNKTSDGKQSINGGYKMAQVNALGNTRVYSKIFLPDTSYNTNSNSTAYNSSFKNAANATYDLTLDSANTLRYVIKANTKNNQSTNDYYSESLDNNGNYINKSNQHRATTSDNSALSTSLLWKHKYKKKFRTLSMNIAYDWSQIKNDGFLKSLSTFYKSNSTIEDTVDQRNINNQHSGSFTSKLAYTEPLFKDAFMEFSYSFNLYQNTNDKVSKQGTNGKYDNIIDSLTNTYQFNRTMNSPGVNFRYNKKKLNYSIGTALGFNTYQQKNLTANTDLTRDFTTIMPRASITYKIKANSNLRFSYKGNSIAPSLDQLQPIKNNNDPLNIYVGNPNLKQSFDHDFSLNYGFWNVLKQTNFWSFIDFHPSQNSFVNSSSISPSGIRHYTTVNTDGVYSGSLYTNFGVKLKKSEINIGVGPTGSINNNIEFINNVKSISKTTSYGLSFNVQKDKDKKYNIYAYPTFQWYRSANSLNKSYNVNYWQLNGSIGGTIYLQHGFEINMDNDFQQRQKDPKFPINSNKIITNAGLKKLFMKNTMELSLMVYDVLNQNNGYDRNFSSYNYSQSYYTTLKRYAMLNFVWNFNKNGAKPSNNMF